MRIMIWLLFAINAVNYLDRQVLSLMLEAIRKDLALTDLQLGLIAGPAFSLIYALACVPAAVWAMKGDRRFIVALSAILWGAMTALGGFVGGFWQLAFTRAGVALGEAGGLPGSHSIVSDEARSGRRVRTLGHLMSGAPVGGALALLIGGLIGQVYGWRVAMIAAGLPGMVLGGLLLLLREPPRPYAPAARASRKTGLPLYWLTARQLWRFRPARLALLAETTNHVVMSGAVAWYPTFLIRVHHFSPTEVAGIMFLGSVLAIAGTALTARVIDLLGLRAHHWLAWGPAVITLAIKPFSLIFLLADNPVVALVAFAVPASMVIATFAPTFSLMHEAVPPPQRPAASAILMSIATIIGIGIGPAAIGLASTQIAATGGDSLRYALVGLQIFGLTSGALYLLAGRGLARERLRAQAKRFQASATP